jgi:S1-C subfamily serine protease
MAVLLSVALSSVFGFLAGALGGASGWSDRVSPLMSQSAAATAEPPAAPDAAEPPLEDMIEAAAPAVVSIVVSKEMPKMEQVMVSPFGDDPFFSRFFGGGLQVPQYRQSGTEEKRVGAGTGFLVSADGYIVTNKHVVADKDAAYTVIMPDETKYEAEVLARDPMSDVAVLRILAEDGRAFPFLPLGDSDGLRVGQTVVAIGYALGQYDNSVSSGIVSGLRRKITAGGNGVVESLYDVIQTDTAINPGNSGGPLLNRRGEAVGVNVAVDQGAQNIGFALPVNDVRQAFEAVRDTGKISRPWLGVRYLMVDEAFAKDNGMKTDYGALIVRGDEPTDLAVIPGSPADKAGLRENDIILEFGGEKLTADYPLAVAAARRRVGEQVEVLVERQGEQVRLGLTLEERECRVALVGGAC